jgi:hypothetical protein
VIPIVTHRVVWPFPLWRSYVVNDYGHWENVRDGWTANQSYARCLETVT